MRNEVYQRSLRRAHPFVVCEGGRGPCLYWNGCQALAPLWVRNWDFARNRQVDVLGKLAYIQLAQPAFLV